jgi:Hydantoinase B/oxoprolinase
MATLLHVLFAQLQEVRLQGLFANMLLVLDVCAGHHADVGGITPGSMPPTSRTLVEEGAAIVSFKLVRGGAFQVRLCTVEGVVFGQCFV